MFFEQYGTQREAVAEREQQRCRPGDGVVKVLREVFLPQGYPDSVTDDYLEYQMWDTAQAFASSITGALATEAVLKGAGVGDETATALAATVAWLLKDGVGMVGRIAFAWLQGTRLDADCKQWRLTADILNDIAILVDLTAPHFPRWAFIYVVCLSSVCRSIVGVAGGATRAALTQHQARRNNLADVSAKDGSQETLVNLVALITSMILLPMVSGNLPIVWLLFFLFTAMHLFSNYKAVKAIRMDNLNGKRFSILVSEFCRSPMGYSVLSITEANQRESVMPDWFSFLRRMPYEPDVKLGCALTDSVSSHVTSADNSAISDKFLLFRRDGKHCVAYHREATNLDLLRGAFCAQWLDRNASTNLEEARRWFADFRKMTQAEGWTFERLQLGVDDWRYEIQ